ncbi:MAG: FHA domain-containing protein, partial [Caulobacteraceae bacterium]|nr:FHA domain-containing protein [Caulobacter sp.]
MALVLTSLDDERIERRIEPGGAFSIGRGTDNDLVLVDPAREVSKTHCRIEADAGRYTLVDLSINGVTLDGQSTPMGPGARHELRSGDVFLIGRQRFGVAIAPDGGGEAAADAPAPYAMPTTVPQDIGQILDGAAEGVESRASLGVAKEATPWLKDLPEGAADETIRQPMGWDAPPATDTILPPDFDQPAASDFANRSEHVPAANSALHVPQVAQQIPTDWLDDDP